MRREVIRGEFFPPFHFFIKFLADGGNRDELTD
jgi:hypothetical protein